MLLAVPRRRGRLTDGQGRTVDLRNVILILTSNLGSSYLVDPTISHEVATASVQAAVRLHFKPEFLNRLDDVAVFSPLSAERLLPVVDLLVGVLSARLSDRRISLTLSSAARQWLASTGHYPAYGARPLRRLVQTAVGDQVARAPLSGEVRDGDAVSADVSADGAELRLAARRRWLDRLLRSIGWLSRGHNTRS